MLTKKTIVDYIKEQFAASLDQTFLPKSDSDQIAAERPNVPASVVNHNVCLWGLSGAGKTSLKNGFFAALYWLDKYDKHFGYHILDEKLEEFQSGKMWQMIKTNQSKLALKTTHRTTQKNMFYRTPKGRSSGHAKSASFAHNLRLIDIVGEEAPLVFDSESEYGLTHEALTKATSLIVVIDPLQIGENGIMTPKEYQSAFGQLLDFVATKSKGLDYFAVCLHKYDLTRYLENAEEIQGRIIGEENMLKLNDLDTDKYCFYTSAANTVGITRNLDPEDASAGGIWTTRFTLDPFIFPFNLIERKILNKQDKWWARDTDHISIGLQSRDIQGIMEGLYHLREQGFPDDQ